MASPYHIDVRFKYQLILASNVIFRLHLLLPTDLLVEYDVREAFPGPLGVKYQDIAVFVHFSLPLLLDGVPTCGGLGEIDLDLRFRGLRVVGADRGDLILALNVLHEEVVEVFFVIELVPGEVRSEGDLLCELLSHGVKVEVIELPLPRVLLLVWGVRTVHLSGRVIHGDQLVRLIVIIVWQQIEKLLDLLKGLGGRRLHDFDQALVRARLNKLEPGLVGGWTELRLFEFFEQLMISHIMLRQDGYLACSPLGCLNVDYQDLLAIWGRGPISSPASGDGIEWQPVLKFPVIG